MLDKDMVESLAHGLVGIIDQISAFYSDPVNEAAYQRWLEKKYGNSTDGSLDTTKIADSIKRHSP